MGQVRKVSPWPTCASAGKKNIFPAASQNGHGAEWHCLLKLHARSVQGCKFAGPHPPWPRVALDRAGQLDPILIASCTGGPRPRAATGACCATSCGLALGLLVKPDPAHTLHGPAQTLLRRNPGRLARKY